MAPSARFVHVVFPRQAPLPGPIDLSRAPDPLPADSSDQPDLPAEHAEFLGWLFARAGLEVGLYRTETLERRLPACLRALHVNTPVQARRLLEQEPEFLSRAIGAMLVGVTSFFRDPPVFEFLERDVLPALGGLRRGLYAWSVGCSNGAEIYSLAILLAELNLLDHSYLLGSDCRAEGIERAREGCFDSLELRNVPQDLLRRHFERHETRWRISSRIRSSVRWRVADILKSREPGVWDLIFFRNTA